MFATALSPLASRAFAGTYQKVGVETGVSNASPHRLIAMLFDGFNDAVTETRSAMKKRDVAAKCVAVTRARPARSTASAAASSPTIWPRSTTTWSCASRTPTCTTTRPRSTNACGSWNR